MTRVDLPACWLTLTLLCSCALAPKPTPHHVAIADTALGLNGIAVQPAAQAWWRSFEDPQLDRLIEAALQDSPGIAQAKARLQLAQAQAAAARAAQLPAVKLSAGETRLKFPPGFPQPIGGSSVWAGDLGALLSWDLDLWGKQAQLAAQSAALAKAANLELDDARLLLAGAVAQAYIDLNHNFALAEIATRAEAQRTNILQIARQRVAAGLDTRVELREAEGALPQARLALLQAQAMQALAMHQLAALSGRGAEVYGGIARPQLNLQAALALPAQLPMNLLERRPDVIAARARIEAADAQQRAAKAAFYPTISLTALAGYASFSLSDLLSARSWGDGAGAALSLPLFDGGRLRAQYQGRQALLEQAVADYDDIVLRAVRQAADQLSLIDALTAELAQQQQWSDAAEEAYRLDQERYQAGLASYLSVLNAETEVLNSRRQAVDLNAALATARISLLLAVGGSFTSSAATAALAAQ